MHSWDFGYASDCRAAVPLVAPVGMNCITLIIRCVLHALPAARRNDGLRVLRASKY